MSSPPIAMCACGEPLVATFAFAKEEFICIRCTRMYGWLEPRAAAETPELLARMEENKTLWETVSAGLIPAGGRYRECDACTIGAGIHSDHATADELLAHDAAMMRINAIRDAAR